MRIAQMLRNRPMAKIGPKLTGRRAAGFTPHRHGKARLKPSGRQESAERSQRKPCLTTRLQMDNVQWLRLPAGKRTQSRDETEIPAPGEGAGGVLEEFQGRPRKKGKPEGKRPEVMAQDLDSPGSRK